MSFQAIKWAIDQKLPAMQKIVLVALANRTSQDTGLCYPSHEKLAIDSGMNKRSVVRQIEALENGGFLKVIRETKNNTKQVNKYHLNIGVNTESLWVVTESHYPSDTESLGVVTESHYPSDTESLGVVTESHYPSDTESLGVVTESHYPSDTESLGVVTESHINLSIETINETINLTTTTTTENPPEKNCGGGDFFDLKIPDLIYPKSLTLKEKKAATKLLTNCISVSEAQEILDALEAAIKTGQVKKSPISLLGGMVRRYEAGTFDPTPGLHISENREQQKKTQIEIERRNTEAIAKMAIPNSTKFIPPLEQIEALKQSLKG